MDGLIILNKPAGITSAKALYRVRKLTGVRKSGHAGTLDPRRGRADPLPGHDDEAGRLMDQPKYRAVAARCDQRGFDSDRPLQPVQIERVPEAAEVASALGRFEGEICRFRRR